MGRRSLSPSNWPPQKLSEQRWGPLGTNTGCSWSPLKDPLDNPTRFNFQPTLHPHTGHPQPQYSSAEGLSQHPGLPESVLSKQTGTQPIQHLYQKVHLESDLLLNSSDSLLRQASNRSYYKYIYSSIKPSFIQMIGELPVSLLALMDAYTEGEWVEQQAPMGPPCSGAVLPGKTNIIKITLLSTQLQ